MRCPRSSAAARAFASRRRSCASGRTGSSTSAIATAKLLDEVARDERVPLQHRLSAPRATKKTLGLPDTVQGCVFDLDGVLTASGDVHAAAWRVALDELLAGRVERTGERFAPFMPFDPRHRLLPPPPRPAAARRRPRVPREPRHPAAGGPPGRSAGRRDDQRAREPEERGAARPARAATASHAFSGSLLYLEGLREAGLPARRRLAERQHDGDPRARGARAARRRTVVDGNTARAEQLRPKPSPDTLLAACRALGIPPERGGGVRDDARRRRRRPRRAPRHAHRRRPDRAAAATPS